MGAGEPEIPDAHGRERIGMTKDEILAKWDGAISDAGLLVAEGNDRDEVVDRLIGEIAEQEGIAIPTDDDYGSGGPEYQAYEDLGIWLNEAVPEEYDTDYEDDEE